jgi:uncharacterized protein YndB with AHSA1/START domain
MSIVKLGPVVKSIDVRRPPSEAFRLFTEEISAWWPMKNHSRAKDWGEVLAYELGHRVVFSFQMGRPKEKSGEVEVRFDPLDAGTCRVTLTHSHWERLGDEAEAMRRSFSGGWEFVFVDGFGAYAGAV